MKTLSILCFERYSKMLLALNSLEDASSVVEVGTTHRNMHVIVYAGEVSADIKALAADSTLINNPHVDILPAYFKQKAIRVDKFVVCVESEKLSTLFQAVNAILSQTNFQCLEVNRSLSDGGQATAIFANGSDIALLKSVTTAQVTVIESPSAAFKRFF